ncbi:hypothetical protein [[Clostridium] innocuum]|uniref:hypothetical protein n=1 Tax=Clostridium innocuum TaxID=1522 RepID=UPI003A4D2A21
MKKVAVEFEETIKLIRTIVCELNGDEDIDFSNYVQGSSDAIDDIAKRMEMDGIKVAEVTDVLSDFENSEHDDIDYFDDHELDDEA